MNIIIKHADVKHVINCVNILQNSEIGKVYFGDYEKTVELLSNASVKQELYIAANENEECLGFIYYMSKGMFGSYPYLHIIAVKEEYRGLGIGKQLIKYFEENASDYSVTKCFLTVDDFNLKVKKWYEVLGYQCIGELTDFYKKGITLYTQFYTTQDVAGRFTASQGVYSGRLISKHRKEAAILQYEGEIDKCRI